MPRPNLSAVFFSVLLAALPATATLQCDKMLVDGHNFNMKSLGGPHSVVTSLESTAESYYNTTYTVDICNTLKKSGKGKKDEECPNGTRACAIKRFIKGDTDDVAEVIPIAGSLENAGGSQFDYELTRLKTSDSNSDSQKEGLLLVLKGGKYPLNVPVKQRRDQQAIIEFLCDANKTGLEGEWSSEDEYEPAERSIFRARDEEEDDGDNESGVEHQLKRPDSALIWQSYGYEEGKKADVLRLTWYTEHACENKRGDDEGSGGASWGFFTWFVIIVFLGIAAYLIFGSWLNYNRYGARGWDLVPHGDTIRDIPYLLKDWTRRILNTVQGTGSRGGYSAV